MVYVHLRDTISEAIPKKSKLK